MYNNYFYKPDGLALKHMIYFMSNSDVDYATFYQTIREIAESRENKREQTGSYPQKLSFMQVERTFHTNKRRNISRARSDSREPSQFCSKCDGIGLRYAIICVEDSRIIQSLLQSRQASSFSKSSHAFLSISIRTIRLEFFSMILNESIIDINAVCIIQILICCITIKMKRIITTTVILYPLCLILIKLILNNDNTSQSSTKSI